MNIYKKRYLNALKKAAKINRFLKKGYHVFWRGEPTHYGFELREDELLLKHDQYTCTCYYQNDSQWDHGYWTKISDWNKKFADDFAVYLPSTKVEL